MMDFKDPDNSGHAKAIQYFKLLSLAKIPTIMVSGKQLVAQPFYITIVPSHHQGRISPALRSIAENIVKSYPNGEVKLFLERTVTVPSAHKEGGDRSIDGHMKSIRVNDNNFNGRNVVLLDDVKTTGGSMSACYHLLIKAGAKVVKPFALLETAGYEGF
ncbi:hypothetical protein Pcaca01_14760 [Pectobacterium carotovorum subsp. carotovorum]|nr:hypothetical protein Pcaca01_14760 [Pectobacterium carotovorum subsp. carotovorum]